MDIALVAKCELVLCADRDQFIAFVFMANAVFCMIRAKVQNDRFLMTVNVLELLPWVYQARVLAKKCFALKIDPHPVTSPLLKSKRRNATKCGKQSVVKREKCKITFSARSTD